MYVSDIVLCCIAGLFSGLKFSSLKYSLDYIFVVLPKSLLNFYFDVNKI